MTFRRYTPLLSHIVRQRRLLLLIIGLTVVASAAAALQPWPVKLLVDGALQGRPMPWISALTGDPSASGAPVRLVLLAVLASLVTFALSTGIGTVLDWAWALAGNRMVMTLSGDVFEHVTRLSPRFHAGRAIGDTLDRLTVDTYILYTASSALLVTPLRQLLVLVSVGVLAWSIHPHLALVSLVVAPLLGASAFYFGERLQSRTERNREAQSLVTAFVQQTLSAIPVVQAFDSRGRNLEYFGRLADDVVTHTRRTNLLNTSSTLVNGAIAAAGSALVLYLGSVEILAGRLTVGSLLVFLAYLTTLQTASQDLLGVYTNYKGSRASMDRIMDVLEATESVTERAGAPALARGTAAIALDDVTFGYEPERPVLRGVSLTIAPGEVVALVGPTGAGKSTLVGLVPRFFDPWSGRVKIDGQDVRDVTVSSVRAQVALVLQEPFLLPLTVAENIAYGRPAASAADIEAAARAANAHEFIMRLPAGYDTVLAERGATLSGGERQRLSIARALLKDAPILILDEPTSALDAETEGLLMDALQRLMRGRTTLIIAHRLSTVRAADRIVAMADGRIVEQGTHDALIAHDGLYARLYRSQFAVDAREVAP